jgi:SAM-dependent methyltransferase
MTDSIATFWDHRIASWYAKEDWASKPSIFVEEAKQHFPPTGKVLELGCGAGQDGLWLVTQGYDVTQTDLIDSMFPAIRERAEQLGVATTLQQLDVVTDLSAIPDHSYDVVHAHLSLHYFDKQTTLAIFDQIHRILKPGGILAALFNSTDDPEAKEGQEIEPNYRQVGPLKKRYVSSEEAREFATKFQIIQADNQGETYKDRAKGVRNLIRLIAKK